MKSCCLVFYRVVISLRSNSWHASGVEEQNMDVKQSILCINILLSLTMVTSCGGKGGGDTAAATSNCDNITAPVVAELAWKAPTANTADSPSFNVAGYKIYYGSSSGNYTSTIPVGKTTRYCFTDELDPGTSYFVVTAYDSNGNESVYSNEVSKIIQ